MSNISDSFHVLYRVSSHLCIHVRDVGLQFKLTHTWKTYFTKNIYLEDTIPCHIYSFPYQIQSRPYLVVIVLFHYLVADYILKQKKTYSSNILKQQKERSMLQRNIVSCWRYWLIIFSRCGSGYDLNNVLK